MRRLLVLTVLAVLAAGCAAPSSTDDATILTADDARAVGDRAGADGADVARSTRDGDGGSNASTPGRRDGGEGDGRTPDLLGADLDSVRSALADVGAAGLHVLAFESDARVTAQYPSAGESLPAADPVLVWLGTPPEPPPPQEPPVATATPEPELDVEGDAGSAASQEEEPGAPDDAQAAEASPSGSPETGGADGSEGDDERSSDRSRTAPVPSAGRTSPRDQPASDPGTSLHGPASWYGPGFEGATTACGGRFDPGELTFASRELRCGTTARITGPAGTVEAQVTDWGPAEWTNRRFDLSQATFAAVAPLSRGVVEVTVEILE